MKFICAARNLDEDIQIRKSNSENLPHRFFYKGNDITQFVRDFEVEETDGEIYYEIKAKFNPNHLLELLTMRCDSNE